MSRSYHKTRNDLKGKTRDEIDAMADDPDSILHELAEKRVVKEMAIKHRKLKKEQDEMYELY